MFSFFFFCVFHRTVDRRRDPRDHPLDHAVGAREYFPKNYKPQRSAGMMPPRSAWSSVFFQNLFFSNYYYIFNFFQYYYV